MPSSIWSEWENRDREEEKTLETDLALECAYIRNMSKEKVGRQVKSW